MVGTLTKETILALLLKQNYCLGKKIFTVILEFFKTFASNRIKTIQTNPYLFQNFDVAFYMKSKINFYN